MSVPCVKGNTDGLAIFQATADQRYLLGEDVFLRTHLPVKFWLRHAGVEGMWCEEDLLRALLDRSPNTRGNRVFLLFGAAGAGKSEVMRWLMLQMARIDEVRNRFSLRIARTELDPVRIVSRVLQAFELPGLAQQTLEGWEELKRKPVALANQMVWQALAGMYESDEEILPLSYRLRPIVEANLRAGFSAMSDPDSAQRPLQLLSREQLEQVLDDTVLDLDPVYEHLQSRLRSAFEQLVLGGVRLVPSLKEISRRVLEEYGVRPILIVDDLVQSMNVYATDLLDYLITLEEGDWDVVLGLTPAAFDWDRRGRELLLRIRELDTVDDRVVKLDLSDPTGDHSAFLDQTTAASFLTAYLQAYKQSSGYVCGDTCPHWETCKAIQWGQQNDALLSPLNPAFIRRMWRKLPSGKGRARYLLMATRRALEAMARGDSDAHLTIEDLIDRDVYVDHPDQRVRSVVECYHPGGPEDTTEIPWVIAQAWGLDETAVTAVHELRANPSLTFPNTHVGTDDPHAAVDPIRNAVRDWLEGDQPNPELLKPLRHCVSRFLKEAVDPTLLEGGGYAQPNGILRWYEVQDGTNLPLLFEGVDEGNGIHLPRSLGSSTFDLLDHAEARGPARPRLAARLLADQEIARLIFEARDQQKSWKSELVHSLKCPVQEFSFHLFRVALCLGANVPVPAMLQDEACASLPGVEWPAELVRTIQHLWEDCFRLRDHLFDGHALARYARRWPRPSESLAELSRLWDSYPPQSYRLGDRPFSEILCAVREQVQAIRDRLAEETSDWGDKRMVVHTCSRLLDGRSRASLHRKWSKLVTSAAGQFDIPAFPPVLQPGVASEVSALIRETQGGMPGEDMLRDFRLTVAWTRAERGAWFGSVVRWLDSLRSVHAATLCALRADESTDMDGARPDTITQLLESTEVLVAEWCRCKEFRTSATAVRSRLEDPLWQECNRWGNLVQFLTPDGFAIEEYLRAESLRAKALSAARTRAETWLDSGQCRAPVVSFENPSAYDVARFHRAVVEATNWWAAYLAQFRLLGNGETKDYDGAFAMLRRAQEGEIPTGETLMEWARLLSYLRKHGTRQLPLLVLQERQDIPASLRHWITNLAQPTGQPITLRDLSVQNLVLLHEFIPEWAGAVYLSLKPEGVIDGVLRVVDGQ